MTAMKVSTKNGIIDAPQELVDQRAVDAEQAEAERVPNARSAAIARIAAGHRTALAELVERFPQTERDGWHELVKDAEFGGGDCIQAYATGLGVTVSEAADRILTARDAYRKAYGKATGTLTKLRDQIDAAETVEALDAINWPD